MKVLPFIGGSGNVALNQYIVELQDRTLFQSYDSIIAEINHETGVTSLDEHYWDYSKTTGKYRNQFLGEGIKDTRRKIEEGKYKLVDLNV